MAGTSESISHFVSQVESGTHAHVVSDKSHVSSVPITSCILHGRGEDSARSPLASKSVMLGGRVGSPDVPLPVRSLFPDTSMVVSFVLYKLGIVPVSWLPCTLMTVRSPPMFGGIVPHSCAFSACWEHAGDSRARCSAGSASVPRRTSRAPYQTKRELATCREPRCDLTTNGHGARCGHSPKWRLRPVPT